MTRIKKIAERPLALHRLLQMCFLPVLLALSFQTFSQVFPVQSTTQLVPPYSVYLSDYATPGNEKLRVILVQRDLTQPSYQLRLVMQVEWNGKVIMRTSRNYNPAPIGLDPGVPTIISGAELFPYLDSRNIDFIGYSREQYERTKALPEGSYRISFTAYDYRRQDVRVSNEGSSFYYLSKNEPPLINMPVCGAKVPVREPQQVVFSWLPRNTSSPTSAMETRYEFSLYEIRPEGRNPNDVVLSSQPVFRTTVDYTQLVYGPAEPQLIENMRYAWRVRAVDTQGRDAFRNNGYSEVCTFTYGGVDPAFNIGTVAGLQAEGESERRGRIWWEKGDFDSYRIYYKKTGAGHEWFHSDVEDKDLGQGTDESEMKLFDLEPDTEYETRAQAIKMGNLGPYTDIIKFRTLPVRAVHCGEPAQLSGGGTEGPYLSAVMGDIVAVDGMEMTLTKVEHLGGGWYSGAGRIAVDYLGGASFPVTFGRIFINADRDAGAGRIDFVTRDVGAMAEEQLARQEKRKGEKEAEDLAVNDNGNEGKDIIFEGVIDSVFVDEKGEIIIIDTEGERFVYGQAIDPVTGEVSPVNIIDQGGNGYVVDKEGNVTEGSGNNGSVRGTTDNGSKNVSNDSSSVVKIWFATDGKEYAHGDVIDIPYSSEENNLAFQLKHFSKNTKAFEWQFIQDGVNRTMKVRNNESNLDNFVLNLQNRAGDIKLKAIYDAKEVEVVLNVVKEDFEMAELYARPSAEGKGKRIAKSGETLYLVDGNVSASSEQIVYDIALSPNLGQDKFAPLDIAWSYKEQTQNENLHQEFGTTHIYRTVSKQEDPVTTTVKAGYPEEATKTVDVQWVDGSIKSFSFVPPATSAVLTKTFQEVGNNLKLIDKVLKVGGVEFKVEPIKITGKQQNFEDIESRLYKEVQVGTITGGVSVKLYEKLITPPALGVLSRVGVADVGAYVTFSFGCYLSGGVDRYKYAESNKYQGSNAFVDFSPKGCLEAGIKARLLVAENLVDFEVKGYSQACLAGQLKYEFNNEKFIGKIYIPPVVVGGKVKIKTKGTLEFELVDWNGSVSITNQYIIAEY